MGESNINCISNALVEVDFAGEFKESITKSNVVQFEKKELKEKIMKASDEELLVVTSTINSPKVVQSVECYDDKFLESVL